MFVIIVGQNYIVRFEPTSTGIDYQYAANNANQYTGMLLLLFMLYN